MIRICYEDKYIEYDSLPYLPREGETIHLIDDNSKSIYYGEIKYISYLIDNKGNTNIRIVLR